MRILRKRWMPGIAVLLVLVLAGCGGGSGRDVLTATILSDQPSDGDIAFDPVLNSFTVTNGPSTLFFGIDSLALNLPEYRAFLDFPLDGTTGQEFVPLNANIVSAWVTVNIVSVEFASRIPTLMDLVTYPPGALAPIDYDSAPLTFPGGAPASRTFDFLVSDVGRDVVIEVTSLMQETQRRGLSDFQVRLLLDFVPGAAGFVGIDDRPTVVISAPQLTVQYN